MGSLRLVDGGPDTIKWGNFKVIQNIESAMLDAELEIRIHKCTDIMSIRYQICTDIFKFVRTSADSVATVIAYAA